MKIGGGGVKLPGGPAAKVQDTRPDAQAKPDANRINDGGFGSRFNHLPAIQPVPKSQKAPADVKVMEHKLNSGETVKPSDLVKAMEARNDALKTAQDGGDGRKALEKFFDTMFKSPKSKKTWPGGQVESSFKADSGKPETSTLRDGTVPGQRTLAASKPADPSGDADIRANDATTAAQKLNTEINRAQDLLNRLNQKQRDPTDGVKPDFVPSTGTNFKID